MPLTSLITPSGNIRCLVDGDGSDLTCVIGKHDFAVQPCTGQPGVTISMSTYGVPALSGCASELFIGASLQPVAYGTTVSIGDFRCEVKETGLLCENNDRHGFQLARSGYRPF